MYEHSIMGIVHVLITFDKANVVFLYWALLQFNIYILTAWIYCQAFQSLQDTFLQGDLNGQAI